MSEVLWPSGLTRRATDMALPRFEKHYGSTAVSNPMSPCESVLHLYVYTNISKVTLECYVEITKVIEAKL